jgi:peptide/nickel transport system permease protein
MTDESGTTGRTRRAAVSPVMLVAGALLPGLGQAMAGRWQRGVTLLMGWAIVLALATAAWPRIGAVPAGGSVTEWIALVTLALLLTGFWLGAMFELVRPPTATGAGRSAFSLAWRRFRRNRTAVAGMVIIALLYVVMILAPLIAPFAPDQQVGDLASVRFLPPSAEHWLGTDRLGRDILSRILYGAQISLTIGFVATAISIFVGTTIGAIAGYVGGRVDAVLMRFTDLVLSFPRLVLLILIVALFGSSIPVLILVLGLTQWPSTSRIVRGDVLSIREREFVQAAHALGLGRARVLVRHVVPNVLGPVIVAATLGIGNTIVLEAGLSFLSLGPAPPTPTWGTMIEGGRDVLLNNWWVSTFPGLAIVLVVLAFNLVGDGLRDALDPRLR